MNRKLGRVDWAWTRVHSTKICETTKKSRRRCMPAPSYLRIGRWKFLKLRRQRGASKDVVGESEQRGPVVGTMFVLAGTEVNSYPVGGAQKLEDGLGGLVGAEGAGRVGPEV